MKTNELTGLALNWAVDKAQGKFCLYPHGDYSTDWAHGGPIIEREKISINRETLANQWLACPYGTRTARSGPTPLIAAMRCYVASKMGDNVELPEGLK